MEGYFEKHQIELAELESIINELNELLNAHKQDFIISMIKYIQKTVKHLSEAKKMLGNIDWALNGTNKDS